MKKYLLNVYMNLLFVLFNNTRPLEENWRLSREYRHLKRNSGIQYDPTIIDVGYKDGVDKVSLPEGFPEAVARLFEDAPRKQGTAYQNLPLDRRLVVKDALIDIAGQLKPIAERYFGSKCRVHWVVVNRLNCSDKFDGDSTFWHSDNCPVGSLKAMVLLKPVSDELGGQFEIMDRPQSRTMRRYGCIPDSLIRSRKEIDAIVAGRVRSSKRFSGKPGDVVWFDNNVLHKGNSPRVVPRDTLLFQFYPTALDNYDDYLRRDEGAVTTAPASFMS